MKASCTLSVPASPAAVRRDSFFSDVGMSLAARSVTLVSSLAITTVSARSLGPANRGDYFLVITIAAFIAQFANLGLHCSNTICVAKDERTAGELVVNSFWIATLLGGAAAAAVAISIHAGLLGQATPGIWYAIILAPATLFFLLGGSLLVGLGRIRAFNALQVGAYLQVAVGTLLAGYLHLATRGFLLITALSWLLSAALMLWSLLPAIECWRFNGKLLWAGLQLSGRAYLTAVLGYLTLRANIFVLKSLAGPDTVGRFSIAAQMGDALLTFPVVLAMVLLPKLTKDSENAWLVTQRCLLHTAAFMLFTCASAFCLAKPLVTFIFGAAYSGSATAFFWLLPGTFSCALCSIVSQYLSALGFPLPQVLSWLASALLIAPVSYLLIRSDSLRGPGLALSICYCGLFCSLYTIAFFEHRKRRPQAARAPVAEESAC